MRAFIFFILAISCLFAGTYFVCCEGTLTGSVLQLASFVFFCVAIFGMRTIKKEEEKPDNKQNPSELHLNGSFIIKQNLTQSEA